MPAANRSLINNFTLGHRIDVKVDPKTAGSASGAGVYPDGDTVTQIAEAKPGCIFTGWSEGVNVVSNSASYSFTSTSARTLVGNFVTLATLQSTLLAPGSLLLSWPAGANGWLLQESPDLGPGSWIISTRTVNVVGTEKQVTVTPLTGRRFFRLAYP